MDHNLTFHHFPYCKILYISVWTFQDRLTSLKTPTPLPTLRWSLLAKEIHCTANQSGIQVIVRLNGKLVTEEAPLLGIMDI